MFDKIYKYFRERIIIVLAYTRFHNIHAKMFLSFCPSTHISPGKRGTSKPIFYINRLNLNTNHMFTFNKFIPTKINIREKVR